MNNDPTITIVAYKQSGQLSYRGHAHDSWDSHLDTLVTKDKNEAIEYVAAKILYNLQNEHRGYEINILINGQDYEWREWETSEQFQQRYDLTVEILNESSLKAKEKLSKEEEKKRAAEEKKATQRTLANTRSEVNALKRRLDQDNIDRDRARLAELEAKLESKDSNE